MLYPPRAAVDLIIADGERLPLCGGVVVIDTPGHTPGHISLHHEPSRTLIAGDALIVKNGQLFGADPDTTLDRTTALASIAKLSSFDIESVICYHGGLFRDNVINRIAELALRHPRVSPSQLVNGFGEEQPEPKLRRRSNRCMFLVIDRQWVYDLVI